MKKTIILVFAIIFGMGSAIAQDVKGLERLQDQVNKEEKAFQDYFDSERSLKNLKDKVKTEVQKHHESVKTALEAIINMQQEQLAACQEELSVFRFFSNTEETIFMDSTLELNGWNKKLTGVYVEQYKTISSIREVSSAITDVENTINERSKEQQAMDWSDEELKEVIVRFIEKKMTVSIAKQLDDIDNMDLRFLSPSQKDYYRKLSERYDEIFNTYF